MPEGCYLLGGHPRRYLLQGNRERLIFFRKFRIIKPRKFIGVSIMDEKKEKQYVSGNAQRMAKWDKERSQIIMDHIGKQVHVVIDRPIGYRHGNTVYPVNYGYIPGIFAGDGEEQDAYILGIKEPITEFDGQVVAAIHRKNDCEDKLVVAPIGSVYHQGQIAEAVHFQEQYFDVSIISCFVIGCINVIL